jgi:hypothetical protein
MRAQRVSRGRSFFSRAIFPRKTTECTINQGFKANFVNRLSIAALKRIFRYIFPLAHADFLRTLPRMR